MAHGPERRGSGVVGAAEHMEGQAASGIPDERFVSADPRDASAQYVRAQPAGHLQRIPELPLPPLHHQGAYLSPGVVKVTGVTGVVTVVEVVEVVKVTGVTGVVTVVEVVEVVGVTGVTG
eukprot:6694513-Pyramimonas_sp.AAC.1